jgi:putative ATP-binding cassette transporter
MTGTDAFIAFYQLLVRASRITTFIVIVLTAASGLMLAELTLLIATILSDETADTALAQLPLLFGVCLTALIMLSYLSATAGTKLCNRVLHITCERIMQAVPAATMRAMEQVTASGVMAALTAERETLGIGLSRFLSVVRGAGVVVGCFALLIDTQPLSAAILVVAFSIANALSARQARAVQKSNLRLRSAQKRYREMLGHVLAGLASLKLYTPRRNALLRVGVLPALRRLGMIQMVARMRGRLQRHPRTYMMSMAALFPVVLQRLDPTTDLVATVVLSLVLAAQVFDTALSVTEMQTAAVALDQIDRLEAALRDDADSTEAAGFWPDRIALEHVEYTHAGVNGFHLGPISLELRRGEILFITGGNGSGKTTLIRLITGLYRAQHGRILCDGETLAPGALAQLFTAVFNDFHLSHSLGDISTASEIAFEDMLSRLELASVTTLEDGRITAVNLSSGQRRRLALAAALIEDRPFCLFDEWTADQDPEFRELFYNTLLPELRAAGRGVIVVTHDDRYFDRCDRHIRLEEGRLANPEAVA